MAGERMILVREEQNPRTSTGSSRRGDPGRPRWQNFPRGGRCARHGQALCFGCEQNVINDKARRAVISDTTLHEGDVITMTVTPGMSTPVKYRHRGRVLGRNGHAMVWADEVARLKVMADADTPEDASRRASSAPSESAGAHGACSTAPIACRSCRR